MEAIGALQACLSSLAPLLCGQQVVHTAAFSSMGSFRASLSLNQPLIFRKLVETHHFYMVVLMLNLDIVPSLKSVRIK